MKESGLSNLPAPPFSGHLLTPEACHWAHRRHSPDNEWAHCLNNQPQCHIWGQWSQGVIKLLVGHMRTFPDWISKILFMQNKQSESEQPEWDFVDGSSKIDSWQRISQRQVCVTDVRWGICSRILLNELQGVLWRQLQVVGNTLYCWVQPADIKSCSRISIHFLRSLVWSPIVSSFNTNRWVFLSAVLKQASGLILVAQLNQEQTTKQQHVSFESDMGP